MAFRTTTWPLGVYVLGLADWTVTFTRTAWLSGAVLGVLMTVVVATWVIVAAGMVEVVVQSPIEKVAAPTFAGVHWKVSVVPCTVPIAETWATPLMVGVTVQVLCPTALNVTSVTVTVWGTPTAPPKPVTAACAGVDTNPTAPRMSAEAATALVTMAPTARPVERDGVIADRPFIGFYQQ